MLQDDEPTYEDDSATADTDAAGEFWLDLQTQLEDLTRTANITPRDGSTPLLVIPTKNGDVYVLTGDVASGPLQRFETLTEGGGGGTSKLLFGADLTDGAARIIVVRELTAPSPGGGNGVFTGGSSSATLDTTATGGGVVQRNPGVGGILYVASTGNAHASQTSVPLEYEVIGDPV